MPKRSISASIIAIFLGLVLTGCVGAKSTSSPSAEPKSDSDSSVVDPAFAEEPDSEEEEEIGNLAFGDAVTYVDDVSISVSTPAGFTPGEYAAGADQEANLVFSITITNGSKENLDPRTYSKVSSGGVESSSIFDSGNPVGDLGGGPSTVILPGGTIAWMEAYSVKDPAAIIFQIAPSYDYNDAIFTNIP